MVSTHSRPKAAGRLPHLLTPCPSGFNTQPPEGGWPLPLCWRQHWCGFNTQPPEGGWQPIWRGSATNMRFQHTAARRRLGPSGWQRAKNPSRFNTQPPEGGWWTAKPCKTWSMPFQHTAARRRLGGTLIKPRLIRKFQHTAARRRLVRGAQAGRPPAAFQHTAARRRLATMTTGIATGEWFQHTAARRRLDGLGKLRACCINGFNTQPPEGGWALWRVLLQSRPNVSTHSRPKAAGLSVFGDNPASIVSTHSRPKAAGHVPQGYRYGCWVSTHSRPKAAG